MGARTERLDVLVLGDGLAAASAALHVRRRAGDAAVALWTSGPAGGTASPPRPGVAFAAPSPDLVAAHETRDEARLSAEVRLARRGLERLGREVAARGIECGFRRTVVARDLVPDDAARRAEHDALARRLDVADDAVFDAPALIDGLRAAAAAEGVAVRTAAAAGRPRLTPLEDGVEVDAGDRRAAATLVVLATEAALGRDDAWVRSLSLPARIQTLALAADEAHRSIPPTSRGPGFAVAASDLAGRLLVAEGIEPSSRGDPFDASPDEGVQARLEEWASKRLLGGAAPRVEARGAVTALYTRDGLPLVGPHPGRAGFLLAAGFNAKEETDGFLAGEVVAEIVVDGRTATPDAARWSTRRML